MPNVKSMNDLERLNYIRDQFLKVAAEITDAYSPQWKARVDVTKSLIPIASAALVFTIAFAPSLIKPGVHVAWRYCLVVSWVSFLCALILSLLSLWFSIGLHDLQANMLERSEGMRKAIAKVDPKSDDIMKPFGGLITESLKPIERLDKISRRLLNTAYVFYGIAILFIGAVGARVLLL
jgi:hypothetical protein